MRPRNLTQRRKESQGTQRGWPLTTGRQDDRLEEEEENAGGVPVSGEMKLGCLWRFEIPYSSASVFFKSFAQMFSSFFHFPLLFRPRLVLNGPFVLPVSEARHAFQSQPPQVPLLQ